MSQAYNKSPNYTKEELSIFTNQLDNLLQTTSYNWEKFYQSVVDWNLAFRAKDFVFTQGDIEAQHKLVLEEFDEVLTEVKKCDVYSLKKELVDLIVVSSFADYIKNGQWDFFKDNETASYDLLNIYNWIDLHEYRWVAQWCISILEELGNFSYIADGILKANWSKIPTEEEFLDHGSDYYGHKILDIRIEHECKMIEQLSSGRYSGVTCKEVEIKGNKHLIFTDSNGKVMKPSCFRAFK